MLEEKTRALVLHVYDHGESDRLIHLYTESMGRVSAIAKGARRSRKRFPGALEILNVLEIRIVDPPRSSLMRLEAATVLQPFEPMVQDLGRYAIGCEFIEILDRFTGDHEANPELFAFALGVMEVVASESPDRLLALLIRAKTFARLGYRPQLAACVLCGTELRANGNVAFVPREGGAVCRSCGPDEAQRVPSRLMLALERGIRTPLRERDKLEILSPELRQAESLFGRFVLYHIGELRSGAFLRDILRLD